MKFDFSRFPENARSISAAQAEATITEIMEASSARAAANRGAEDKYDSPILKAVKEARTLARPIQRETLR